MENIFCSLNCISFITWLFFDKLLESIILQLLYWRKNNFRIVNILWNRYPNFLKLLKKFSAIIFISNIENPLNDYSFLIHDNYMTKASYLEPSLCDQLGNTCKTNVGKTCNSYESRIKKRKQLYYIIKSDFVRKARSNLPTSILFTASLCPHPNAENVHISSPKSSKKLPLLPTPMNFFPCKTFFSRNQTYYVSCGNLQKKIN